MSQHAHDINSIYVVYIIDPIGWKYVDIGYMTTSFK